MIAHFRFHLPAICVRHDKIGCCLGMWQSMQLLAISRPSLGEDSAIFNLVAGKTAFGKAREIVLRTVDVVASRTGHSCEVDDW